MKFGKTFGTFTPLLEDSYGKIFFKFFNVKLISDIYQNSDKHYVDLDCSSFITCINNIDNFAQTNFPNHINSVSPNNTIRVKLPFRYNRYQIQWENLSTSGDIKANNYCNITIQIMGITKTDNDNSFCSFKCVSFNKA